MSEGTLKQRRGRLSCTGTFITVAATYSRAKTAFCILQHSLHQRHLDSTRHPSGTRQVKASPGEYRLPQRRERDTSAVENHYGHEQHRRLLDAHEERRQQQPHRAVDFTTSKKATSTKTNAATEHPHHRIEDQAGECRRSHQRWGAALPAAAPLCKGPDATRRSTSAP